MLFIAFLIVAAFTFIGWYITRDVFSPFVLQPGVWFGILLLFYLSDPELYPIIHDFPISLIVWTISFLGVAYPTYYYLPDHSLISRRPPLLASVLTPSRLVLKLYLFIAIISVPLILYTLMRYGMERGESNLMTYLRIASYDDTLDKPDLGVAYYTIGVALIVFIFIFVYSSKKWLKILAVVINVLAALISMSKTGFFVFLVPMVYVLYLRGKIKLRTIGIILLIFIGFSIWFQYARSMASQQDSFSATSMLTIYIMSPCVAFDYYVEPASATHFGEYVFRFYYAIMHSLGSNIEPVSNVLKFVGVPEETNTYTILYPFYHDFGLPGVGLFGGLYGAFYAFLYKRAQSGQNVYFILYACFLNYLILQFVQENILSNFSLNLQYIILILFPYIFQQLSSRLSR